MGDPIAPGHGRVCPHRYTVHSTTVSVSVRLEEVVPTALVNPIQFQGQLAARTHAQALSRASLFSQGCLEEGDQDPQANGGAHRRRESGDPRRLPAASRGARNLRYDPRWVSVGVPRGIHRWGTTSGLGTAASPVDRLDPCPAPHGVTLRSASEMPSRKVPNHRSRGMVASP